MEEGECGDAGHHRKERNFPALDFTESGSLKTANQPILVIQSPKTPTLSRKLKAVSLDSDPPKNPEQTLDVARDVFSMPNTPKKQLKVVVVPERVSPKPSLVAPSLPSSNLKKFASNTSISGSQTLKTLPEIMTLQDFSDKRPEPVRIKAKGLLERRGSNASLTIDLGSSSNLAESRSPTTALRLTTMKSASHLNLTSFSNNPEKCNAKQDVCDSLAKSVSACKNRCYTFHRRCNCLCNFKCRRKSLSNENLYVPPCNFCQWIPKDKSGCKGCRKAVYPRQPDLEPAQMLSEDFKLHLQNIQYLQTAGSVLSVADLQESCAGSRVPKLHQEFWEVPLNLQEKCMVSGSQSRNRYKGVLPNEHSRVVLPAPQSYIHANYIKGPDYAETAYIATQGPMAHTCTDFWEMVWSTKSDCIVMLTGLVEKGTSKCELYFPLGRKPDLSPTDKSFMYVTTTRPRDRFTFDVASSRNCGAQQHEEETFAFEEVDDVRFGCYRIRHVHRRTVGECQLRQLELSRITDLQERRIVKHYWYSSWQDHKMASPEQVLELAGHILDGCDKDNKAKAPSSRNCDKTTRQDQNAGQADNCDNNVARGTPATATPRSNGFAHERPGHRRFERTASLHSSHKKTVGGAGRQADYSREKRQIDNVSEHTGDAGPVVVHCSAGIGRTGCFLAVLNGIRQLRSNFNVDVLAILCSLRLNRGGMVQTAEQYELIHRVLSLYSETM